MAEMRASPVKSQALKRLADIVRSVEQGGEMEFLPFNPMSLFPVSSTTLENLAYGNLPMAIPSQSNIPITKTGRKQEVAELAGLLPTLPAASRGVAQGANYLGDVLTQAVTRNPQATSMRALEEIGRMSPVPQMFDPRLAKRVMPETKAVGENKNPILVYSGAQNEINQFEDGQNAIKVGAAYFSNKPEVASAYALDPQRLPRGERSPTVYPSYLDLRNPLVIDAKGSAWNKIKTDWPAYKEAVGDDSLASTDFLAYLAKKQGHDGLIVKNVKDNPNATITGVADVYVPFQAKQIKSAISDPDIMEQFLKGK